MLKQAVCFFLLQERECLEICVDNNYKYGNIVPYSKTSGSVLIRNNPGHVGSTESACSHDPIVDRFPITALHAVHFKASYLINWYT